MLDVKRVCGDAVDRRSSQATTIEMPGVGKDLGIRTDGREVARVVRGARGARKAVLQLFLFSSPTYRILILPLDSTNPNSREEGNLCINNPIQLEILSIDDPLYSNPAVGFWFVV